MGGNYDEQSRFASNSVFGNKLSQVRSTKDRPQPRQTGSTQAWEGLVQAGAAGGAAAVGARQSDDDIEKLALFDAMTGLYNSRTFMRQLSYELKRGMRYKRPVAVLMVSIDWLDNLVQQNGEMAGDHVRKLVSAELNGTVRDVDFAARYSAREFAALLPETNANGATVVAERLRKRVSGKTVNIGSETLRVTVSIGIAAFPAHGREPAELITRGLQALEIAVQRGGDRHCTM